MFPSTLAGRHLYPNTVMDRLRDLGVNLLGARNRAIGELVLECPPSLVAEALGYSPQVAFLHAEKAAEPWGRPDVCRTASRPRPSGASRLAAAGSDRPHAGSTVFTMTQFFSPLGRS
jgi:hypothetical protein